MEVLTISIPLQPFVKPFGVFALLERLADPQPTDGRMKSTIFFV
jgi:hypothetical protein